MDFIINVKSVITKVLKKVFLKNPLKYKGKYIGEMPKKDAKNIPKKNVREEEIINTTILIL